MIVESLRRWHDWPLHQPMQPLVANIETYQQDQGTGEVRRFPGEFTEATPAF